jgi:predicted DNA-binding transcriptional regulator YafY
MYEKKLFRLMTILNRLESGGKATTTDLSEEFRVTPRTVQRDLELLHSTGFLVTSPEKGLHKFEEGYSLKKMKLSPEEASLLSFFSDIAGSLGEKFGESFRHLTSKIIQAEYDSPYYAKIPAGVKMKKDYPFINDLEEAVLEGQKVKICYKMPAKEKTYTIRPYKIVFFDGFWYLLSQIDGKRWIVKFRLDRITDVEVLSTHFGVSDDIQAMLDQSVNIWFEPKPTMKVVLKIDKDAAPFFKEKRYFPNQKVVKTNRDGSLIIEAKAGSHMEVAPTVMHWMPLITVISPKALKDEVKSTVARYLHMIKK